MAKSPSIILREIDDSAYAITTSDTSIAVIGYATKGPIGIPTLTTSRNEFVETFGIPPTSAPWSHLAVYKAFNQGNQVIFVRVAETTGVNAAIAAEKIITNASPATAGYQTFSETDPVAYGSYTSQEIYDFKLEIDGSGVPRDVYIASPISGDWNLNDIATQINTQITSNTSGFQEFSTNSNPSIATANKEFKFKVSIDGTDLMTSVGTESNDFSVFLNPGDTLSEIATDIETALTNGTHGYQTWTKSGGIADKTGASPLAITTSYDFNIAVDGGAATDISITTGGTAPTWQEVAELMQTAINSTIGAGSVKVYILEAATNGKFMIVSDAIGEGASSIALVDDTIATGGTPFFAALDGGDNDGTIDTAIAGGNGTNPTDNYTVNVNANTGRIRITSDSTGTSSEVAITAPTIGNYLGTLLGGVLEANDGEVAISATASISNSKIKIISDATGTSSSVEITEGNGADNEHLIALLAVDTAVDGEAEVLAATTDNILFRAKEKGTQTNNISVVKSSRTSPIDGSTIHKVEILYREDIVETFDEISLTEEDTNFFVTKINSDPSNGGSEWIEVEYEDNDDNGVLTFTDGTYTLGSGIDVYTDGDLMGDYDYKVGTDGIPTSGGAALFTNVMTTSSDLANQEEFDYHILLTPDNGSEATQNAAISLAEYRKDFIYVADPPYGLTYDEVADWHNGSGGYGRNTAMNSSYAATYWPWLKTFNSVSGEYVWCPPSVFIGEKYMEVDRRYGPWYAPAGDTRGKLIASDYETSPSFAQREILYGDLNAINPIVNFPAKGLEIYGQKTLLRANSALNRVNVRRMVIYVKKLIKSAMEGIVFEQHTQDTWTRATNFINSILEPVRQQNGISDYRVIIDNTTNTADVIAQGIMKGIIKLVPVGVVEIIDLKISILSPGATIT